MNRIIFKLDENGHPICVCADRGGGEVYIIQPSTPRDRVYQWSSLAVGTTVVQEEIGGWPMRDRDHFPAQH
jgi:hypothetical protein